MCFRSSKRDRQRYRASFCELRVSKRLAVLVQTEPYLSLFRAKIIIGDIDEAGAANVVKEIISRGG